MPDLRLTASFVPGELTQPLLDGVVAPAGVELSLTAGKSVDANSRQMLDGAFDVAEMSFATFLKAHEQGRDLIGLPMFTGRGFLQPGVVCREAAGIDKPEDLRGKRVGLPQFWQTSSVWHRGILEQQHGVRQQDVTWCTAAEERFEGLRLPEGVRLERLDEGHSVGDALAAAEVDAIMTPPRGAPKTVGGGIKRAYADVASAEQHYFAATGVFPIMHFVVMRQTLAGQHAWLPEALFAAFKQAKQQVKLQPPVEGMDPGRAWAYGLAPNRGTLETFLDFCSGLGWLARRPRLEDLFAASTLALDG